VLVKLLVEEGYSVRALVRPLSHIGQLEDLGVEIFFGDVRDLQSLINASEGMDTVIHAAAGLRGSTKHILESCIAGTQNIAEASRSAKVRRVIYLSSMSVYDFTKLKNGDVISEQSPLDDCPELRGAYSLGKRKAEDIVLAHLHDTYPSWTILRPSVIVGQNKDSLGPIDAFQIGSSIICMSPRQKKLRMIHVEDVTSTVVRLLQNDATQGKIFVLSSPEKLSMNEYIQVCVREVNPERKLRVMHVPYWFAKLGVTGLMVIRKVIGKGPSLNLRRLAAVYREVGVTSDALNTALDWQPRRGLLERLKNEKVWRKIPKNVQQSGSIRMLGTDRETNEVALCLSDKHTKRKSDV
jgi:dihydroflavonol-4-reductase